MLCNTLTLTRAVVLAFGVLPASAFAQATETAAEDAALFAPMVDECVQNPTTTTCEKVRAVVTECAAELDDTLCDVLFTNPSEVFDTPALQAEAQDQLTTTSEAIANITFADLQEGAVGDVVEESRADAERSMLRGDENLMSHSGPPSVEEN